MLPFDWDEVIGARMALHAHPVGCAQPAAVARGAARPDRWAREHQYLDALWLQRCTRRVPLS